MDDNSRSPANVLGDTSRWPLPDLGELIIGYPRAMFRLVAVAQ
jgi:hypothetical protein